MLLYSIKTTHFIDAQVNTTKEQVDKRKKKKKESEIPKKVEECETVYSNLVQQLEL